MSLKYALTEAYLTAAPDDYVAQVQDVQSHDMDSIVQKMSQKGSTVTKTDVLAVLNTFFEVLADITKDGEALNLPLLKTSFSVQGVFDNASDTFDAKRHRINLNVQAGKALKEVLERIGVEKTTVPEILPHIMEVKDAVSGTTNDALTSGGVVELIGSRLKIEGENAKNGLYFIDKDNTAHKATTLVDNKPARLIAIAPELQSGEYTVQVTTQYSGGGTTVSSPRTGICTKVLTVAS